MKGKTTRTPASICPWCGGRISAATNFQSETPEPKPGDLSVCIGCAGLLTFNDDLTVRKFADDDLFNLETDERVEFLKMRAIILERLEGGDGL